MSLVLLVGLGENQSVDCGVSGNGRGASWGSDGHGELPFTRLTASGSRRLLSWKLVFASLLFATSRGRKSDPLPERGINRQCDGRRPTNSVIFPRFRPLTTVVVGRSAQREYNLDRHSAEKSKGPDMFIGRPHCCIDNQRHRVVSRVNMGFVLVYNQPPKHERCAFRNPALLEGEHQNTVYIPSALLIVGIAMSRWSGFLTAAIFAVLVGGYKIYSSTGTAAPSFASSSVESDS